MNAKAAAFVVLLCLTAAFVWLVFNSDERSRHLNLQPTSLERERVEQLKQKRQRIQAEDQAKPQGPRGN